MKQAWIPTACIDCGERWESTPAALPAPGNEFDCPYCGSRRPVSEFVATTEGLEILEAFHR